MSNQIEQILLDRLRNGREGAKSDSFYNKFALLSLAETSLSLVNSPLKLDKYKGTESLNLFSALAAKEIHYRRIKDYIPPATLPLTEPPVGSVGIEHIEALTNIRSTVLSLGKIASGISERIKTISRTDNLSLQFMALYQQALSLTQAYQFTENFSGIVISIPWNFNSALSSP